MPTHAGRGGSSLPRYLTSFIGRHQEIAQVTDLLTRDDVRLLTLTGPGGAGKTRLAIEVVARLDESAWEDTWFVSLVTVRDPVLVLPAIAQAIGLPQVAGRPVEEAIIRFLGDRCALLVIDNFELVTGAAPDVGRILAACPGTTMLVTSRIALRISGEHLIALAPLPIPDPGDVQPEHLRTVDSVQLFLARANSSGRSLVLTRDNARDMADICRRLDGLPLALELAAARSGILSPSGLLELLGRGSGILSSGPQDAPERHRSMSDAIAWSYDLLPDDEQTVFRRLAVFSGGFSLEAAEAVVNLPVDMLAMIASLANKSLVVPVQADSPEPRFSMLETLREFGLERLAAEDETSEVRACHASYFLQEAIEGEYAWCMYRADGLRLTKRLIVDQGNMREALMWLDRQGEILRCLRLAAALGTLWVVRGDLSEGHQWLDRLLRNPDAVDGPERVNGLATLSWICSHQGLVARAFDLAEEGLAISQTHSGPIERVRCLMLSGIAAEKLDNQDMAVQRHRQALSLLHSLGEPDWIRNWVISENVQLGIVEIMRGSIDEADILLNAAAEMDRSRGFEPGASHVYGNYVMGGLGLVARAKGDKVLALRSFQQHLRNAWRSGNVNATVHALSDIAGTLAGLGQLRVAARLFGAAEALHEFHGYDFSYSFNLQRAFGLPAPWARADEPLGAFHSLWLALGVRRELGLQEGVSPNDLSTTWAEGRALTLETAVAEALAADSLPEKLTWPVIEHRLSTREIDVLRLVAEGRSNRAIADTLSLSERTVEHHLTHILAKLDLDSRTAAATFAVRNGLI